MRARLQWSLLCRSLYVFLLVLALAGCSDGDGDDDNDDVLNFAGSYVGTIQDSVAGQGIIALTLAQSGTQLTGTGQTTFANPANNTSGSIEGEVIGTAATLMLIPSNAQSCPLRATVTLNGNQAAGTYAAFNCPVAFGGTLSLTRQ